MTEIVPPINVKAPLVVLKREFWELFRDGTKRTEYRRNRGMFNERVFYPGRWVRLAYRYNLPTVPTLLARVEVFRVAPVVELVEHLPLDAARAIFDTLHQLYAVRPEDPLAAIVFDQIVYRPQGTR